MTAARSLVDAIDPGEARRVEAAASGMAGVAVGEREQTSNGDRRQAMMAVANMVESLLRGSGRAGSNPMAKISSSHLSRLAIVCVRQSTVTQVRFNTESTQRQYGLASTAELS